MTIRPPEELHERMKCMAKKRGYTLNQLILHMHYAQGVGTTTGRMDMQCAALAYNSMRQPVIGSQKTA
jgi:hypothetical protein